MASRWGQCADQMRIAAALQLRHLRRPLNLRLQLPLLLLSGTGHGGVECVRSCRRLVAGKELPRRPRQPLRQTGLRQLVRVATAAGHARQVHLVWHVPEVPRQAAWYHRGRHQHGSMGWVVLAVGRVPARTVAGLPLQRRLSVPRPLELVSP